MSDSPTLKEIARTLKGIESALREQNRILKTQQPPVTNNTVIQKGSEPVEVPPLTDPDAPKPRVLGWSIAGLYQREGTLIVGDIKNEQDDSQWIWTGEIWERVELPNAVA